MATNESGITRRSLLTGAIGAAAVAALRPALPMAAADRVRVIRVESAKVWRGDGRDPAVVSEMIARGVSALTGEAKAEVAWTRFFKPGMRVGLKINLLGRPLVYTAREITDALAAAAIAAGVTPQDVIVWDRHRDHFEPTVYRFGRGRFGERIESGGRYDDARVLRGSGGAAPMDTMASQATDVTVNLPVLKDHGGAGVTLALKNVAFGCYRHHGRAHGGNCDPYIAEAYEHYLTVTRVPLIVLDATEACYDQGPQPGDRSRMWRENAIYVATDPVALDVVTREIILDRRRAAGLSDKRSQSRHIETAAAKGLGVGDASRIDVTTIRV
jgi:Domain of unknown function (DUF362)